MEVSEAPEFRQALIKKIAEREFAERTGTHCSDLLYCLNKQALRRRLGDQPTEQDTLLFSLGWATQRWLSHKWTDEAPIEMDGILVTCDANAMSILANPNTVTMFFIPWELKCTYQSSSKDIMDNPAWIRQIMAQCYVQNIATAVLTRFELMGNWKSVFGKKGEKDLPENGRPSLHAYTFKFTSEELAQNWDWLRNRKVMFEALLAGGELLPKILAIPSGQSYECDWCRFKGVECLVE